MKIKLTLLVLGFSLLSGAGPAMAQANSGLDTSGGQTKLPFSIMGTTLMTLDATVPASPVLTTSVTMYALGYFHNSDARLKTNIRPAPGLDTIERLNGVSYNWQRDGSPGMGVLAQDVEKVIPGAVRVSANGYKAVDYDQLMGPMIEAIKELKAQNDKQAAEIAELRKKIGE